jgi:hypothetical protein
MLFEHLGISGFGDILLFWVNLQVVTWSGLGFFFGFWVIFWLGKGAVFR